METELPDTDEVLSLQQPVHIDRDKVSRKITWMLGNLNGQFDRLKPGAVLRETMLADIGPDHEFVMDIVRETLQSMQSAVEEERSADTLALYRSAVQLTDVPPYHPMNNPEEDPRRYYWQILNWFPEFESLRNA